MKMIENSSKSKSMTWLLAPVIAVLVAGCGGGGGASDPASGTGTLGVSLTDTPACGFDQVNVTVDKVRVHQSSSADPATDAGWTDITLNPARKINLLDLNNGTLVALGETPLAAGHYTQLRLVLDPNTAVGLTNSVVPTGGVETALVTPSAVQSGIKLVNQFDVASGQRVDLLLDFDACKSIVKRGNGTYALKPVVKVIPFVLNGIEGFVDTALLGSGVLVTAQQNGVIVQTTAPNATTGKFFLGRLPVGNYDVVVTAGTGSTAGTANGRATEVIAAVPVATSTSVTVISSSTVPFSLPVSDTHVVSGTAVLAPTSATEVAYVAAKQTIGNAASAPIVTMKFVAADDSTTTLGAYALNLPVGAPWLGPYSTTLPIVFTSQPTVAGKYTIEASANGYQTQTSAIKDISAVDVTQSFTLLP